MLSMLNRGDRPTDKDPEDIWGPQWILQETLTPHPRFFISRIRIEVCALSSGWKGTCALAGLQEQPGKPLELSLASHMDPNPGSKWL